MDQSFSGFSSEHIYPPELDLDKLDFEQVCRSLRESNPGPTVEKTEELAASILSERNISGIPQEGLASVLHIFAEAAKQGIPELELSIRREQAIDPNLVAAAITAIQTLRPATQETSSDWGKMGKLKVDTSCIVVKANTETTENKNWKLSRFAQGLTDLSSDVIAFVFAPELLKSALHDLGRILADEINITDTPPAEAKERNNAILAIARVLDQCDRPVPYPPEMRYGVERLTDYFSARVDSGSLSDDEVETCRQALGLMGKSCVLVGFSFESSVPALGRAKIVDCFYSLFEKHLPAKWGIAVYNNDKFTPSDH